MSDLTGNNELTATCADWLKAKKQLQKWKKIEEDAKIHIINQLNKNQVDNIVCGRFEITRKTNKGSDGKIISLDDVGKVIGVRKASTSILINEVEQDD